MIKMNMENVTQQVIAPEGVTLTVSGSAVTAKGSKGEVSRNFLHPKIKVKQIEGGIEFVVPKFTKNEKKMLFTFRAHAKNMLKGVSEGHLYKLKVCSGHFPMNVSIKGNQMEVKNFIGEAVPRKLSFKEGVDVKLDGEIIQVSGIDKELTAQTAASIEKLTRRNGFDRRIFQDGIYIIEKDGKMV